MTGAQYEKHVAEVMKSIFPIYHSVRVIGQSNDRGVDVLAYRFPFRRVVIQCKCCNKPLGRSTVQEAYAAKKIYRAKIAAIVSFSGFGFTWEAMKDAKDLGIELWEA